LTGPLRGLPDMDALYQNYDTLNKPNAWEKAQVSDLFDGNRAGDERPPNPSPVPRATRTNVPKVWASSIVVHGPFIVCRPVPNPIRPIRNRTNHCPHSLLYAPTVTERASYPQGEKALTEKTDMEVFGPYAANLTKLDWEIYEKAAELFWIKLYDVYQSAGFEMICRPSLELLVQSPPAQKGASRHIHPTANRGSLSTREPGGATSILQRWKSRES
jgi:hypothetical protein